MIIEEDYNWRDVWDTREEVAIVCVYECMLCKAIYQVDEDCLIYYRGDSSLITGMKSNHTHGCTEGAGACSRMLTHRRKDAKM